MKPFLIPILLVLSFSACSQDHYLDDFYNKYKSSDSVSMYLSLGPTFWLSSNITGIDQDSWKSKVSSIHMLILDGKKLPGLSADVDDLSRRLHAEQYDDLVQVRKGKHQQFEILVHDVDSKTKDLVLLVHDTDGGTIFAQVRGKFTDKDLEKIKDSADQ
jgi:hypothetical protein